VQRNSLESDEVVARRNGFRDGCGPGRVVRDHLAISPLTIVDCTGEETGLVDLEPLEGFSIDTGAR
jgi:hypothetical protein